jgi:hypothetical protein
MRRKERHGFWDVKHLRRTADWINFRIVLWTHAQRVLTEQRYNTRGRDFWPIVGSCDCWRCGGGGRGDSLGNVQTWTAFGAVVAAADERSVDPPAVCKLDACILLLGAGAGEEGLAGVWNGGEGDCGGCAGGPPFGCGERLEKQ